MILMKKIDMHGVLLGLELAGMGGQHIDTCVSIDGYISKRCRRVTPNKDYC